MRGFALFLFVAGMLGHSCVWGAESLSLKVAIEKALTHSPRVVQAREDVRAADADVSRVRAAFFPTVKAEFKAGTYHDRIPNPGDNQIPATSRDRNQYVGQVVLDQPIFSGFGTLGEVQAARANHKAAQAQLVEVANETASEVIRIYFGLQLTDAQMKAERETMALLQKKLEQVRLRTHEGRSTQLQLLQAEYAVQAKVPAIQDLEMDWDLKKLRLSALTGEVFPGELDLVDELAAANKVLDESQLPKLNDAIKSMFGANSHLSQLDARIEEKRSLARKTSSAHLPSLNFILNAGTNAYQRPDIATPASLVYGMEVKVTVPLFSGFSSVHEASQTNSLLTSLHKQYENERNKLLEDVTRAYREWETAALRIEAEKKNVQLTRSAISQAESLFQVGRVTLTEVLDTYSNALSAKRALEDAIYRRVDAIARIRSLMGSLVPSGMGA